MKIASLLALAALTVATSGSAATLFTQGTATGPLESPGSVSFLFEAGAGAGLTSFTLNGFASLDGVNPWGDTFTLSLNGVDILSGSYNLGGGGDDVTFYAPAGSSISVSTPGLWQGGTGLFQVPLALVAGTNTLTLGYGGGAQGLGDEGWGVSDLLVSGSSGAVPEAATWALMITGFGMVGFAIRRRQGGVLLPA